MCRMCNPRTHVGRWSAAMGMVWAAMLLAATPSAPGQDWRVAAAWSVSPEPAASTDGHANKPGVRRIVSPMLAGATWDVAWVGESSVAIVSPPRPDVPGAKGSAGSAQLWRWGPEGVLPPIDLATASLAPLACASLEGDRVLVAGRTEAGTVKLIEYDARTAKALGSTELATGQPRVAALTPGGQRLLVSGVDRRMTLWDPVTGDSAVMGNVRLSPRWIDFSADGRRVVVADHVMVRVFDVASGRELMGARPSQRGRMITSLAISPDGRWVACVTQDSEAALIEIATGDPLDRWDLAAVGGEPVGIAFQSVRHRPVGVWWCGPGDRGEMMWGSSMRSVDAEEVRVGQWNPGAGPAGREQQPAGAGDARSEVSAPSAGALPGSRLSASSASSGAVLRVRADGLAAALLRGDGRVVVWVRDASATAPVQRDGGKAADSPAPAAAGLHSVEHLERAWQGLGEATAAPAREAVARMIGGGDAAADFILARLTNRGDQEAWQLVAQLGDDDYRVRVRAQQRLAALGQQVSGELRRALDDPDDGDIERRWRIERLLERLDESGSTRLDDSALRVIRAVEVLEAIGSPRARSALESMVAGDGSGLAGREAAAALERLAG